MFNKFCEEQYEKYLEDNGIDTVCFMGYGYHIEDIKIGADFYISYKFWCRNSDNKRALSENPFQETLENCLIMASSHYPNIHLLDRFTLIKKYKLRKVHRVNHNTGKIDEVKTRVEHVIIRNERTKEKILLTDEWIENFHLFLINLW